MSQNNLVIQNTELNSIIEFNLYLSRFIHHSWIKSDKHYSLISSLIKNNNVHCAISQYLMKKFNIIDKFDYDFSNEYKKIILADYQLLKKLSLYLGMVFYEKTIRTIVLKSQREQMIAVLGKEEYLFAVRKARFFLPQMEDVFSQHMIPWHDLQKFKNFLYTTGFKLISYVFKEMSAGFKTRLLIKLDKKWQDIFYLPNDYHKISQQQCIALIIKTFKEVKYKYDTSTANS